MLLDDVRRETDAILVGYSGGKDSATVLEMCVRTFPRVEAFFMWLAPGMPMFERHFRRVEARYGIRIRQTAHPNVSRALKEGLYCEPQWRGSLLKQIDVENRIRAETGISWIAYGHRATDSIPRNAMLRRNQGFDAKGRRVYPIWDWNDKRAYAFCRANRLLVMPQIGGKRTSGVALSPRAVLDLYRASREDFEALRKVFPHIMAIVKRSELEGEEPKIRDADDAADGAQGGSVQPAEDR